MSVIQGRERERDRDRDRERERERERERVCRTVGVCRAVGDILSTHAHSLSLSVTQNLQSDRSAIPYMRKSNAYPPAFRTKWGRAMRSNRSSRLCTRPKGKGSGMKEPKNDVCVCVCVWIYLYQCLCLGLTESDWPPSWSESRSPGLTESSSSEFDSEFIHLWVRVPP